MALWPVFADLLPDLELSQSFDHERPDQQSYRQRRQAGKRRSERQVSKDPEDPEVGKQLLIQQPVEQSAPAFMRAYPAAARQDFLPMLTGMLSAPHLRMWESLL